MAREGNEWHYFTLSMKFEDPNFHEENVIDLITWKQWVNNALRRTHGIFGEGIEYSFLHQESTRAYIQVASHDKDSFASAISTYTSDNELVGSPVFVLIENESTDLRTMDVSADDQVWVKRTMERNAEESQCN
ncbi:hypothetical protein HG536_0D02450 [Torulaspora globosa]|uniref:Ribonucleases P/MRP subunit Pop8-like domain-containing protein n=1 Tax=Torulaspora globosa TaxID=48254 RepID=A0A7G3ZGT7_9SACH|nr:uncharacterized protein HG536_0D02450 [Torulaspora globosa]QLL32723.1 hypothetical protein HG536_0D02450 [Torulaspora globosa]